jgi:enoyl-[acyl-carrier protein] reductase I
MQKTFEGKNLWALVLGGSSGLGLASAKKLARHGMNICIVYRSSKSVITEINKHFNEIISEKINFFSFNRDALNPERRTEILSEIKEKIPGGGKVKLLLHSIGKGNLKPMISKDKSVLKNDDFHLTIDAMAVSLYDWTKEIFEKDLFSADARIISFTSEGNQKAWRNYAAVSASKAALEAITRNIALEFAPFGIKANCIQAGITDTPSFRMIPGSEQLKEITEIRNPFKRLTTPEDIANAVYLLTLDEAAWINGTVIPVNGGEHLS